MMDATMTGREERRAALAAALRTLAPATGTRLDMLVQAGSFDLDVWTAAEYLHEDAVVAGRLRFGWMGQGEELRLHVANGAWSLRYRSGPWSRSRAVSIRWVEDRWAEHRAA